MNHENIMLSEISQTQKNKYCIIPLICEESRICKFKRQRLGFPGGVVVENLPANAGDTGSGPGLGRSHMPQSN